MTGGKVTERDRFIFSIVKRVFGAVLLLILLAIHFFVKEVSIWYLAIPGSIMGLDIVKARKVYDALSNDGKGDG